MEKVNTAIQYNRKASKHLKENQANKARTCILDGLKHYPSNKDLLLTASDVFRAQKDYESSTNYAKQLILFYPDFFDGYCRAAQDLSLNLSSQDEAVAIISEGLSAWPDEPWILHTALKVYIAACRTGEATKLGDRLLKSHSSFKPFYHVYINFLMELNDVEKAEKVLNHGLTNFPTEASILRLKLAVLFKQKKHFEYRNLLFDLIKKFPSHFNYLIDEIHRFEVVSLGKRIKKRISGKCDVCCIVSDESPYIAEFIHHYIFLGFSHIFIGINNSSDATLDILHKIALHFPNVHILDVNDAHFFLKQKGCYRVMFDHARKVSSSMYCLFVDVDEFWIANPFPTKIEQFLSKHAAFDVYSFHWILLRGESLFSPPLSPSQEYTWNKHLKSICSYDSEIYDLRCHTPSMSTCQQSILMRGNSPNTATTFKSNYIDIHQVTDDYRSSPIGNQEIAWILHRIQRSELEYAFRLFKRHANDFESYFKTNRGGYHLEVSTPGIHEYISQLLPVGEILTYHTALDVFIKNCDITQEVDSARSLVTEAEIRKRLDDVPTDIVNLNSSLMPKIFAGTRFADQVATMIAMHA